jgi:hypothetical protein
MHIGSFAFIAIAVLIASRIGAAAAAAVYGGALSG